MGSAKWPSVLEYLWWVYHSTAEPMPTKFLFANDGGTKFWKAAADSMPESNSDADEPQDVLARRIESIVLDLRAYERDPNSYTTSGPGTLSQRGGAVRFLQHSSATSLYYEYKAVSEKQGMRPDRIGGFNVHAHFQDRPQAAFEVSQGNGAR